jgi:hypothetical protein
MIQIQELFAIVEGGVCRGMQAFVYEAVYLVYRLHARALGDKPQSLLLDDNHAIRWNRNQ